MQIPSKSYSASSLKYRYGFNGKENDNEVKGEGNQINYGMRAYDPRIGRFLSLDPLQINYPELTPYQFSNNNPILFIDIDGLEGDYFFNKDAKGKFVFINYVDHGKGAPNRFFVRDAQGTTQTKNRFQYDGQFWEMEMIPSTFYTSNDYVNSNPFSPNSRNQFDTDRASWLEEGADYSDLDYVERFWKDFRDNPEASNMMQAIQLAGGRRAGGLQRSTAIKPAATTNKQTVAINKGNQNASIANAAIVSEKASADPGKGKFSQPDHGNNFSLTGQEKLGVKSIPEAVSKLKSGEWTAANLPIDYVIRNNQMYFLNTRSIAALKEAGIPRSQWVFNNQSTVPRFEKNLSNNLRGSSGFDQVTNRETGKITTLE